jgi:hypothetical protein
MKVMNSQANTQKFYVCRKNISQNDEVYELTEIHASNPDNNINRFNSYKRDHNGYYQMYVSNNNGTDGIGTYDSAGTQIKYDASVEAINKYNTLIYFKYIDNGTYFGLYGMVTDENGTYLARYSIPSGTFSRVKDIVINEPNIVWNTYGNGNSVNVIGIVNNKLYTVVYQNANQPSLYKAYLLEYDLTENLYNLTLLGTNPDERYQMRGHFSKDEGNTKDGIHLIRYILVSDTGLGTPMLVDNQLWTISKGGQSMNPDVSNQLRQQTRDKYTILKNGYYNPSMVVRMPAVKYFALCNAQLNIITENVTYRDNGDFVNIIPVRNTGAFEMTETFNGGTTSFDPKQYHIVVDPTKLVFYNNTIDPNGYHPIFMIRKNRLVNPHYYAGDIYWEWFRGGGDRIDSNAIVQIDYVSSNSWYDLLVKANIMPTFPNNGYIRALWIKTGEYAGTYFPMDTASNYWGSGSVRKYMPLLQNAVMSDGSTLKTSGIANKGDIGMLNTQGHGAFTNGGYCLFYVLEDNVNISTLVINNSALAGEFSHVNDPRVISFAYQDYWYDPDLYGGPQYITLNCFYYGLFKETTYVFPDKTVTIPVDYTKYSDNPMFYGQKITQYSAPTHRIALNNDPQTILANVDNQDNIQFMFGFLDFQQQQQIDTNIKFKPFFELKVAATDPSKINEINCKFYFAPTPPIIGGLKINYLSGSFQFLALATGPLPFSDPGLAYGWRHQLEVDELVGQVATLSLKTDTRDLFKFGRVENSSFFSALSNPATNTGYFSPRLIDGKFDLINQTLDNLTLLPYVNGGITKQHSLKIVQTPNGNTKGMYVNDNGNIKTGNLTDLIDNT